jgi:hypothetical protein
MYDEQKRREEMKVVILAVALMLLVVSVGAVNETDDGWTPEIEIHVQTILNNYMNMWMIAQQSQRQEQHQNQFVTQDVNVVTNEGRTLDVGSVMESRLVYPGEVLVFNASGNCSVRSAYPVGLYGIDDFYEGLVISTEAIPTYDPIYHKMEFGIVPVSETINFWTTKATLNMTKSNRCVVDNRAPGNVFTTVEVIYG